MSLSMLHVQAQAACPSPGCLCNVHAACPCLHGACPCRTNMLHEHGQMNMARDMDNDTAMETDMDTDIDIDMVTEIDSDTGNGHRHQTKANKLLWSLYSYQSANREDICKYLLTGHVVILDLDKPLLLLS